jgi:hypothetical protein
MPDERSATPVTVSEQPWTDPWDGLLTGTYRRRLSWQLPGTPDHLVVYIRGAGGDATCEYVSQTTICGQGLDDAARPERVSPACPACLDGAAQAFRLAREHLAETAPHRLE